MPRLLVITAIAALVPACGDTNTSAQPDLVTQFGSGIYLNAHVGWISAEEASSLQSELQNDLATNEPSEFPAERVAECLSRAIYEIEDYPVAHCSGESPCFGWIDNNVLHVGAAVPTGNGDGPRSSALKHESLHWLQLCVLNVRDPQHKRPEWGFFQ